MPRILPWSALVAPTIFLSVLTSMAAGTTTTSNSIGVNWGTQMSHPVHPKIVVKMLQDNGIKKVKLFDADQWTMSALAGSGIDVMVAIPNDQLGRMSEDYDNAEAWVKENVTAYDHKDGVRIKYVAVGNEPFLESYNGSFLNTTLPSLKNIQKALDESGAGDRIKATVPLNSDVYGSPASKPVPSAGAFRADISSLMVEMVRFLDANKAPFVVNIYPFLSLYQNPDFPADFAFFDGVDRPVEDKNIRYTNMFDANYDTLVSALKKAGIDDMKIIVGEAGWPTDGNKNANLDYAKKFYSGLLKKLGNDKGTPLRPGSIEVYLFGLIDENMKSVAPGTFERHWGIFTYDGKPKFPMDLSGQGRHDEYLVGAKGIEYMPTQWCVLNKDAKSHDVAQAKSQLDYACSNADCTPLGPGSSCHRLDVHSHSAYGFNIYFQMSGQDVRACDFGGLAKITTKNASEDGCLFPVQIISDGERTTGVTIATVFLVGVLILLMEM